MRRVTVAALLSAALVGCGEAAVPDPPPAPVDEEAQARRTAKRTVRSFCLHRPVRRGNRRARGPASRHDAVLALRRLRAMARRHSAADDPENPDWNLLLANGATFLEKTRCLPREVPRLDRELRFFEIPEADETNEDYPPEDYEPPYP